MESSDFYIGPLFFIIYLVIGILIRNKLYADSPLKKYFLPGLCLKLGGAFMAGIIYFYYYGDGDTVYYFDRTKYLNWLIKANPEVGWKVFFSDSKNLERGLMPYYSRVRAWDAGQFIVVKYGTIFSFFTFCNYTGIALTFAAASFTGVWVMFKTFVDINPKLIKEFAIACLFIPSVFFWGSGLFKDTMAIGFLGWLTYSTYMIFIKKQKILLNVIIAIITIFVLKTVKAYVIMAFLPALMFWIFFKYRSKITSSFLQVAITPIIIVITLVGAYVALSRMGGEGEYWSMDQMEKRAHDMQWWHTKVVELYGEGGGGSFYSIGSGDFSTGNIIKSFIPAINVTLFRPYLWEVRNPVMLLSSIESMIFFFFTLKMVFSTGLGKLFRLSIANPEIFFCLLFTIIFAFAVGFTSFNFGALVRYKIPCIPFFVVALFMLRYHANMLRNKGELAPVEK